MQKKLFHFILFIGVYSLCFEEIQAQQVKLLSEGNKISLRGLSVVNDDVFWASGSNGTVARSVDGGLHIQWMKVAGYEKRDFRDIEAFDSLTAIIMAVAEPGVVLKTVDGGKSWRKVYEDMTQGIFLDAMDFKGNHGIVIGDPIDQHAYIITTADQGDTWIRQSENKYNISLRKDEAFFAASGSNILLDEKPSHDFMFISGGVYTALYHSKGKTNIAMQSGASTTGGNGIALDPSRRYLVVVGGDFARDKRIDSTVVFFDLKKKYKTFNIGSTLNGYRSGVEWVDAQTLVACGTSGVDISTTMGKTWKLISPTGLHVVKKSPSSTNVYFAGPNGRIAKLIY